MHHTSGFSSLGLLLILSVAGRGPASIAPTAQTFADVASMEADEPDRRRLLHVEGGDVLRERCRRIAGTWEVRHGREWEPLDVAVLVARVEREVLAEAKRRLASLPSAEHDGRVGAAAWMIEQGLNREALQALNRVLAKEREHPGALALIDAQATRLYGTGRPSELSSARLMALLASGARGPLAESELAVHGLAEFAGRTDLRHLVEVQLSRSGHDGRAFAALLARRLFPGEFVPLLVERALWDPYETVRRPAAMALGQACEAGSLDAIAGALRHGHSVVRLHAVEALSHMGSLAAVEPLIVHLTALSSGTSGNVGTRANLYVGHQTAIVRDFDVEIAQGQSIADPIVGVVESGVILDVRSVVQISRSAETRAVTAALQTLSGASIGTDAQAWHEWWQTQQKQPGALNPDAARRNILPKNE